MIKIDWVGTAGFQQGYAVTKSGKNAYICQAYQTTGVKCYYSVFIEGDKRNAATRATIEKVQQILESR